MRRNCPRSRPKARPGTSRPALLYIRLTDVPTVRIIADNWYDERDALGVAQLVQDVVRTALQRHSGSA